MTTREKERPSFSPAPTERRQMSDQLKKDEFLLDLFFDIVKQIDFVYTIIRRNEEYRERYRTLHAERLSQTN